jgi:uncharacterized membrane protein (DUF485 family)
MTFTLLVNVELLVKNKSSTLAVSLCYTCRFLSRNVSLVIVSSWLHCVPLVAYSLTVSFSQFMSPRLKSPLIHRCAPFAVGILVMEE